MPFFVVVLGGRHACSILLTAECSWSSSKFCRRWNFSLPCSALCPFFTLPSAALTDLIAFFCVRDCSRMEKTYTEQQAMEELLADPPCKDFNPWSSVFIKSVLSDSTFLWSGEDTPWGPEVQQLACKTLGRFQTFRKVCLQEIPVKQLGELYVQPVFEEFCCARAGHGCVAGEMLCSVGSRNALPFGCIGRMRTAPAGGRGLFWSQVRGSWGGKRK